MTFPQSFCDNFCPEATPYLPLYYWTRTSFSPPKSRTEAPLPSPRVPSHKAVLPSHYSLLVLFLSHSWVTFTVQFSNGKLQNPGNMRFTLYNSNDVVNPRLRNQRILVSAEFRLSELCKALQASEDPWCGGRYGRAQGEKRRSSKWDCGGAE